MASTTSINTSPNSRGRKKRDGNNDTTKRFSCADEGCGRSFTRAEHLQRHVLNHSNGEHTCERCRAHFKRKDLLERHIARHRQKDEEAGAEGCGLLATRKRMWKDADGNIVTKKPNLGNNVQKPPSPSGPCRRYPLPSLANLAHFPIQDNEAPISPPISNDPHLTNSWDEHDPILNVGSTEPTSNPKPLSTWSSYPTTDERFWSFDLSHQPLSYTLDSATLNAAPFDDIFNPDTASSFNNPFTTPSNYNWLFDIDLAQPHTIQQSALQDPLPEYAFNRDQAIGLQLDHMNFNKSYFSNDTLGPSAFPQATSQPQIMASMPLVPPPRSEQSLTADHVSIQSIDVTVESSHSTKQSYTLPSTGSSLPEVEQPMSRLQSRNLPIVDEMARQEMLDLIDIIQPTRPDGSIIMRDHPLLALACLQTYCNLFFLRFNTVYPLIHVSTFDPSKIDTLLLTSVFLLGATYAEEDAHQLAICIHDVLRPQIFASAGFSAKPGLWVLQTILLVECFGKSRAGQKQHDLSHLFHGLLINLIRRSDCQTIRAPTLQDTTGDLENDWRTWCDAEQKKRLAFLSFMWDTEHAVLFSQSLCMAAFELRSHLPCEQSLFEADTAERWYQLRQQQPTTPLFLSCLKMYLHPNSATFPRNLNALSRSLILHGLMSIAWDMQRRDQTSLGLIDTNPLGDWRSRLATAYDACYTDYTSFCASYLSRLPSPNHPLAQEFHIYRTANLALYHAAHILLHTPFLDLQIYAGARHILGRPVARADYTRSQRVFKKWVAENADEAGKAMWHAAALVGDSIDILDHELGARLWHHPWTVYIGTLVIWGAWHARPHGDTTNGEGDEIVWNPDAESRTLLDTIRKTEPGRLLNEGCIDKELGKRGINGLAVMVGRRLSKVRWAVVHDAMMVLNGLVQWRLIGESRSQGVS